MPFCRHCSASFDITDHDLAYYEMMSPTFRGKKELIPPPDECPDCRMQQRLAFRNEHRLYHRTCDRTGKRIISIFAPESPFKVYDRDAWWSDAWDALAYGRDPDFSRPFFTQFNELQAQVPRLHLFTSGNENSDFVNYSYDNKRCYLVFGSRSSEDTLFSNTILELKSCMDMIHCEQCELCYECIDSHRCYASIALRDCNNCRECVACYDCIGCSSCIACNNLRNKQYCFRNEQLTKEEFEQAKEASSLHRHSSLRQCRENAEAFHAQSIHRALQLKQCEDCLGSNLVESSRSTNCFDGFKIEDCKDSSWLLRSKECRDVYGISDSAFIYQAMGCNMHNGVTCVSCRYDADLLFCDHCFYTESCFGCVGLRHKKYCILNRQYSKEDYEEMVPRLIDHMRMTQEWCLFFPINLSPFAYNETMAQEYFPLTKEETVKRGWRWREETDETATVAKTLPANQLPDSIDDVSDDILNWAILPEGGDPSASSGQAPRPFKIIKQELEFYRKMRLPIPRLHPDERHRRRMALRNPRKLWTRKCQKCRREIQTTYAPDHPEIVFCESCYLKEVY